MSFMSKPLRFFGIVFSSLLISGCYTVEQGYQQVSLFFRQKKIEDVLAHQEESPERLKRLALIPKVLSFAKDMAGLTPGRSYQKYISLDEPYVVWIVQAADKRSLSLKTWEFPFVGSQPYLGFFRKESALKERQKLIEEGYDTVMGGVTAFSLLGYYPDPLYSSMLDQGTTADFIETLVHECVHRTLYLPDFYTFNENLADFVARHVTVKFLETHPIPGEKPEEYLLARQQREEFQKFFRTFLIKTKKRLEDFYEKSKTNIALKNDDVFLEEREKEFQKISEEYRNITKNFKEYASQKDAFFLGKINNALILSSSVYEAHQEPLQEALNHAKGDLRRLMDNLSYCLKKIPAEKEEDFSALWERVSLCGASSFPTEVQIEEL